MGFMEELYDNLTSFWFQRLNNVIKWLTELCALVALIVGGAKGIFAKIVKIYLIADVIFQGIQIVGFWVIIGYQLISGQITWKEVKEMYKKKAINTEF